MNMSKRSPMVTPEHLKQFDEHGFFILPSVLPPEHMALLREAIDRAIVVRDKNVAATLDGQDAIADGLILCSAEGKYFFFMHENDEPEIKKIIFSTYMEEIVRAMLGDNVYYNHSEIVSKRGVGNENTVSKTSFRWHQDSGYISIQHTPYISCWCAVTEMTTTNGAMFMLPVERNPPVDEKHKVIWSDKPRPGATVEFPAYQHRKDENSSDLDGYFGSDPGVEILCPAGSIVVFSSLTLHCSSANRSNSLRSAFNMQFSPVKNENAFRYDPIPFVVNSETTTEAKEWQQ